MRCECAAVGGATAPAEPVHLDVVGDAHCGGGIGVKGGGRGGFLLLTVVVMKGTGKLTLSAITTSRPAVDRPVDWCGRVSRIAESPVVGRKT